MSFHPDLDGSPLRKDYMDKILNHIVGDVIVTDRHGKNLYCSDGCLELYQCSKEELFSCNCFDAHTKGYIDRVGAAAECIRTQKRLIRHVRTAEGADLMIHCQPIFDDGGELEMVVTTLNGKDAFVKFTNMMDRHQENLPHSLRSLAETEQNPYMLHSKNQRMERVYSVARQAAQTDSTVILYGESGVGKEILAKSIHDNSRRSSCIFLPVNCASIPSELMESELFGYEAGTFTGAKREGKSGLFEMADGGTIFLDEIGDFPLYAQAKLLRVLESGAVRRIGGEREQHLNVRTIAATNRDLRSMVEEGTFREDLYYRLNILPLYIPPLRERTEDIMDFADYYLALYNKKYKQRSRFASNAEARLTQYPWPGNVRELRNAIERLVITAQSDRISASDLWFLSERSSGTEDVASFFRMPLKDALALFEREYLQRALRREDGNIAETARKIGIHRTNLYKAIKRLNIEL